ncbi:MAG: hypothetical protein HY549_03460 [Elusimicrobia bacterium]|nr:hypothetical protein [Elusimicrobiota bacterium]
MHGFAETVRRLRDGAGYSSARAFYRAKGGQNYFGCTYKAYLNIESGRSVPQPRLAYRIAAGLGLLADGSAVRNLVLSYLYSTIGSEDLAGFLAQVLSERAVASGPEVLFQKASASSMAARNRPLTQAQVSRLYGDEETYWCFTLLSNDYAHWTESDIVRSTGYSLKKVRAATEGLLEHGLIARDRNDKLYCPDTGKVFIMPREKFFRPRFLERLRQLWGGMSSRRGATLLHQGLVLRASESSLKESFPYLAQSVYGAHLYGKCSKAVGRPDTAMFVIEVMVKRLSDF